MRRFALSIAALACLQTPAQADLPFADPQAIMQLIKSEGYVVELTQDPTGDPKLVSKIEGSEYNILFYGCENHLNCRSLHFLIGFDLRDGMQLEAANEWNRGQRFASTYLDDEMDPFLQMDVNIEHGVADRNFTDSLEIWRSSLSSFKDFIDW